MKTALIPVGSGLHHLHHAEIKVVNNQVGCGSDMVRVRVIKWFSKSPDPEKNVSGIYKIGKDHTFEH